MAAGKRRAVAAVVGVVTAAHELALRAAPPDRSSPRVSYAVRVPAMDEPCGGGIVKLQRLATIFPNRRWRFNVLYLVSSRLPVRSDAVLRLAARRRIPVVWNQNGVAYPAWHGSGWERTNEPLRRGMAAAAHVVYQSEFCKTSADRFLGPASVPWDVLHNAVDTARFAPSPPGTPRPRLTILVGGTQDVAHRLHVALEALAVVRRRRSDVTMLVTGRLHWGSGEAQARAETAALVAKLRLDDHVRWIGAYTQAAAPELYRSADLLLHAKYNDPSPGLVVEAMACGLPVVYSATGGVVELVGKDAGIGVPSELSWDREVPPDPVAMADAVLEVAARRREFAEAARERAVRLFDIRPWLERHREIFERVLA